MSDSSTLFCIHAERTKWDDRDKIERCMHPKERLEWKKSEKTAKGFKSGYWTIIVFEEKRVGEISNILNGGKKLKTTKRNRVVQALNLFRNMRRAKWNNNDPKARETVQDDAKYAGDVYCCTIVAEEATKEDAKVKDGINGYVPMFAYRQ